MVVIVSIIALFALTSVLIDNQTKYLEEQRTNTIIVHQDCLSALISDFNSSLCKIDDIENEKSAHESIEKFTDSGINITKININIADSENKLVIIASNISGLVGEYSEPYFVEGTGELNYLAFENGDTFLYSPEDEPGIIIGICPINQSGTIIGTYEIHLSMREALDALNLDTNYIFLVTIISLFLLIFSFLYLLRKFIVKPVITFRDASRIVGKGNLEHKVELKSNDEIGELADAFNQMAKDLKESRDKVEEYNKILENLLKQKDEFIGQLGHDLKNPLQPLVGLLPMLIEQEKDPKLKEAMVVMNTNVEYMRDLIFKTLQLAKLRSSNIKFDFEKLKLKEEVDNVITSQKIFLDENKIKIKNNIDSKIFVKADKLRLAELFKNLITNSVKYTKGAGKITIDAEIAKRQVTVSLKDTGIGMSKEQLKKVFNEFYKADRFSSEMHSSGLGLAICKRIIEKHGGKIWVDSPGEGKGSTFYFTLKLKSEK
jgi:signal transduction histidine kinase